MKWQIPAKTFALGEYVAMQGGPAILLLTSPVFVMHLTAPSALAEGDVGGAARRLQGIHPDSPAGRFWLAQDFAEGLRFEDPYEGRGGFGASSAQFVGAYRAYCQLLSQPFDREALFNAYQQVVDMGSGYDVLAQTASSEGVYIHRKAQTFEPFAWPFKKLHFSLMHTGQKCQTHQHLSALSTDLGWTQRRASTPLEAIVHQAKTACEQKNEQAFADAINQYHAALLALGLMSPNSDKKVRELLQQAEVLAAKGCGAMGADVILLLAQ